MHCLWFVLPCHRGSVAELAQLWCTALPPVLSGCAWSSGKKVKPASYPEFPSSCFCEVAGAHPDTTVACRAGRFLDWSSTI
mmetsp:Transcript_12932/g.31121  ORF Transcript_12932/g.31121 Transcript_12932/m.31121 type:complete len:81 (-) Transcript_12932:118-360(-)